MQTTFTRSCDQPHAGLFTFDIKVFLHPDLLSLPAEEADRIANAALVRVMADQFKCRGWEVLYFKVAGTWFRAVTDWFEGEKVCAVEPCPGLAEPDFENWWWWRPDCPGIII